MPSRLTLVPGSQGPKHSGSVARATSHVFTPTERVRTIICSHGDEISLLTTGTRRCNGSTAGVDTGDSIWKKRKYKWIQIDKGSWVFLMSATPPNWDGLAFRPCICHLDLSFRRRCHKFLLHMFSTGKQNQGAFCIPNLWMKIIAFYKLSFDSSSPLLLVCLLTHAALI